MTLGTRSKKKEIGTLLVHKKGTIQNTNVGWVRNKAESRLGTSKEDWGTKNYKIGNYNRNIDYWTKSQLGTLKNWSFIHAPRTNKEQ